MKLRFVFSKRGGTVLLIGFIIIGLQCCFLNPIIGRGYEVRIEVKARDLEIDELAFLEKIAVHENFKKWDSPNKGDHWFGVHYYKEFSEEERKRMDGKYIGIHIFYDKKDDLLDVRIENIADGQSRLVKAEIDRIASIYIKTISEAHGEANLRIIRARTGLGI